MEEIGKPKAFKGGEDSFSVNGIYRKVRFPEYLVQLIYSAAVALIFNSWIGLFVTALLLAFIFRYVPKLNRIMENKYKNAWMTYQKTSKRVLPYLF
jgi:protein-S-isoprenylcysteine O-methyltransferase Ste14